MVGRDLQELFGGRVALIHNSMSDALLDKADVVVTVGYVSKQAAAALCFFVSLVWCLLGELLGRLAAALVRVAVPALSWADGGGAAAAERESDAGISRVQDPVEYDVDMHDSLAFQWPTPSLAPCWECRTRWSTTWTCGTRTGATARLCTST